MTWAHVSNLDGLMQGVLHDASSTKEEVFENVKDDCLLPQSGLQYNKVIFIISLSDLKLSYAFYMLFNAFFPS